jgi:hypothetical protein
VLICLLGLAFACLGFGLFLVGATGSFKGSTTNNKSSISVETAAPGLVVMVCATFVIYLATDLIKAPSIEPPVHARAGSGSGSNSQSAGSGAGSSAKSSADSSAGSGAGSSAGTGSGANDGGSGTGSGSGSQGPR